MWSRDALAVAKCELADVRRSCNTTTAQTTATTYMYAFDDQSSATKSEFSVVRASTW